MNEDNRMDELIRAAAADYNVPRAVPRDEMWTAIEAGQKNRTASTDASPGLYVVPASATSPARVSAVKTVERETTSRNSRPAWWSMAAAATLLVATGAGIGRLTTTGGDVRGPLAGPVASVVTAPPAIVSAIEPAVSQDAEAAKSSLPAVAVAPLGSRAGSTRLPAPRPGRTGLATAVPGSQSAIPYQVATIRHLTDAEALLTSFALESRDQRTDSRLAGWAKGLLSNTRLLLDSPAGDDPRRAKLLEDLELVLAQIVQLSPGAAAQERDLIDGSIRNGAVMTRLRTAIPAGPTRGFQGETF